MIDMFLDSYWIRGTVSYRNWKWKRRKTWRAVIRSAVTSPGKEFVVLPFFSSMIRPLALFSEREPLSLKIGLHHNIVRKASSVQKKTNMKNADKEHTIFYRRVQPIVSTSWNSVWLQYLSINQVYGLHSTTCV